MNTNNHKPKPPKTPNKLQKGFSSISDLKDFTKITVFICLMGDLFLCYYIWSLFSSFDHFKIQVDHSLQILKSVPEFQRSNLPLDFHLQMHKMVIQMLKFMLGSFIVIHSLIYTSFYFEKKFALKYLKFMIWPAAISCFLIGLAEISVFDFTYLFFPLGVLYVYVAIHLKKVRYDNSGFTW